MKNRGNIRIRFSLEKLNGPNIAENFRATIEGKFAPHFLENQDTEIDALTNRFNTAVTETTNHIFGKHRPAKKPSTEVVRARHMIIWTGQDYPTGKNSRRETKRQTEETMGRQHQRVDWP